MKFLRAEELAPGKLYIPTETLYAAEPGSFDYNITIKSSDIICFVSYAIVKDDTNPHYNLQQVVFLLKSRLLVFHFYLYDKEEFFVEATRPPLKHFQSLT